MVHGGQWCLDLWVRIGVRATMAVGCLAAADLRYYGRHGATEERKRQSRREGVNVRQGRQRCVLQGEKLAEQQAHRARIGQSSFAGKGSRLISNQCRDWQAVPIFSVRPSTAA